MRYSRQEALGIIGVEGQQKLSGASAAIVGVGALGSCSAELLTRAGIGKLVLIDPQRIELSNLQRQCLFDEKDIGKSKVSVARKKLSLINSGVEVITHDVLLGQDNLDLLACDLIIDGTDNLEARFLINRYASERSIPFIFGSVLEAKGMMFVSYKGPCLRCLIGDSIAESDCASSGVLNTIPRIISSLQVTEAMKILTGIPHAKELIVFDAWKEGFLKIKVKRNPRCPACTGKIEFVVQRCKTKAAYSAKPVRPVKLDLDSIKKGFKVVMETPMLLVIDQQSEIIVHRHGELMFKTLEDVEKIRRISEKIYRVGVHGA